MEDSSLKNWNIASLLKEEGSKTSTFPLSSELGVSRQGVNQNWDNPAEPEGSGRAYAGPQQGWDEAPVGRDSPFIITQDDFEAYNIQG